MSGTSVEKAASIQAPIAKVDNTNGRTGVTRRAISGSAQNEAIPAALQGSYVTIYCTAEVQYAFGIGAAPALTLNQTSTFGAMSAAAGKTLPAGQDKDVPVPRGATHIGWIGTTGFLEIYCSETPAV